MSNCMSDHMSSRMSNQNPQVHVAMADMALSLASTSLAEDSVDLLTTLLQLQYADGSFSLEAVYWPHPANVSMLDVWVYTSMRAS